MRPLSLPARLLFILATAIPLLPSALAQQATGSADTPTVAEQYLLSAANQERAARNLPLLRRDPQLARAAERHAQLMAEHGAISHQFPGEPELASRAKSAGVAFSLIAENVAEAPSSIQIQQMWMHSPEHRANMLNPNTDSAGIAVVARNGQLYAVEDFTKTVPATGLAAQESAIGALVARTGRIALDTAPGDISAARRTCAISTGYAGPRKPWFVMRFTSNDLTQLPSELKSQLASGRYRQASVGACAVNSTGPFAAYSFAVLLFP